MNNSLAGTEISRTNYAHMGQSNPPVTRKDGKHEELMVVNKTGF